MTKATFSAIPEDAEFEMYDDFEEMSTPNVAPAGPSSTTTKAKSVMPSSFFKDATKSPIAESVMASAMFKDDARAPKAKSVMQSRMFRDTDFKSVITTKMDKIMSQRQTQFKTLPPKEQEKQTKWAQDKIAEMAPCPDQYVWERCDQGEWGGMVCSKGRHAMLDQHLSEGLGAMIMVKDLGNLGNAGAVRFGPWYPHPSIMNCSVHVPGKDVTGVESYPQPAFFGSVHQCDRAKWEYYSENPGDMVRMKYTFPQMEPPEEWAFEKNVPEPKDGAK